MCARVFLCCVGICLSGLVSTVLYIVLNFIHNQTLASDTNIFASVFQFLFLFASDALQAFISYQDAIT